MSEPQSPQMSPQQIRAALPAGVDIVTAYDRSAWIWATLRQFFETLGIELVVLIVVTLLFLRNIRTAVGPIATRPAPSARPSTKRRRLRTRAG